MKKIKEMFQSPQSRYGTYSMVITAVVIAIVIVINMIAGQLPDSMKSVDLSGNSLYEITKTSKKLLKNLDKEVQIHVLAEKSSTDERIHPGISLKAKHHRDTPTSLRGLADKVGEYMALHYVIVKQRIRVS